MNRHIIEITEKMTTEEIIKEALDSGADSIYIKGGDEPLKRDDIVSLVAEISKKAKVKLETDGQLLEGKVLELKEAGVTQIAVTVDSLKHSRFKGGEGDSIEKLVKGMNAVIDADIKPLRVCVTLKKGFNDDEIIDYLQLTFQHNYEILYIIGEGMTKEEVLKRLPGYIKSKDDESDVEWGKYPGAIGRICFEK